MAEGPQALKKDPLSEIAAPRGGLFFWCCPMRFLLLLSLLYALPRKSQALHGKFTELTGRPRRNAPVSVPFRRKVCYTGLAALPADIVRKGGVAQWRIFPHLSCPSEQM